MLLAGGCYIFVMSIEVEVSICLKFNIYLYMCSVTFSIEYVSFYKYLKVTKSFVISSSPTIWARSRNTK